MKITIYELLGLVKEGKAPKKIKFRNEIYEYENHIKDSFIDYVGIEKETKIKILEAEIEQLYEFIAKIQHLGETEQQRLVNLESKGVE